MILLYLREWGFHANYSNCSNYSFLIHISVSREVYIQTFLVALKIDVLLCSIAVRAADKLRSRIIIFQHKHDLGILQDSTIISFLFVCNLRGCVIFQLSRCLVRLCILFLYHYQIIIMNSQPLFRVSSRNNGMRCMFCNIHQTYRCIVNNP